MLRKTQWREIRNRTSLEERLFTDPWQFEFVPQPVEIDALQVE